MYSPNLSLSYLLPNQAQKHVTVNDTFRQLDAIVQLAVMSDDLAVQPAEPDEGDRYILPDAASGDDWARMEAGAIAAFQDGAWQEYTPKPGWIAWNSQTQSLRVFQDGAWGSPGTGVTDTLGMLGINTAASSAARLSVKSDSALFSHDDVTPGTGDMRLQVNRADMAGTASLIFQNDYSGRAELGLAGDDNFRIRLSEDGEVWEDYMVIEPGRFCARLNHFLSLGCTVPADFWKMDTSAAAIFQPYGYLGTNGSFGYGLWYNGYRNNSGGWNSLGVHGSNVAAGIELQESGCYLRHETAPAGLAPAVRLVVSDAGVAPGQDNSLPLGSASARWSQIYAASGTISTSDARDKSLLGRLDARERRVARHILEGIGKYRWKASEQRKGLAARTHVGVTAQGVAAAFAAEGLNAADYGLWCEDELFHTEEREGQGLQMRATGETRQGLRHDELMLFLMGALLG